MHRFSVRSSGVLAALLLAIALPALGSDGGKAAAFALDVARPEAGVRVIIVGDPQVTSGKGPWDRSKRAVFEQFVRELDGIGADTAVIVGDLVEAASTSEFEYFGDVAKGTKTPLLLVHGNHDGRKPDTRFVELQKRISPVQGLRYAVDAGAWRFLVLPCNIQLSKDEEVETLDWLEAEIRAHSQQYIAIFNHYPILPVGLSQVEAYTAPKAYRNRMLDLIAAHPQVRAVFTGHVHNGILASTKTSWTLGKAWIINAPTLVEARAFGEELPLWEDVRAHPQRAHAGFFLDTRFMADGSMQIDGRRVGSRASHRFPDTLPNFDPDIDPRWRLRSAELPASERLLNGQFSSGLDHWMKAFRYHRDSQPAFVVATPEVAARGGKVLRLEVLPVISPWSTDEFVDVYQLVRAQGARLPRLRFDYLADYDAFPRYSGGFVRLAGYASDKRNRIELVGHFGAREGAARAVAMVWDHHDSGERARLTDVALRVRDNRYFAIPLPDMGRRWRRVEIDLERVVSLDGLHRSDYSDVDRYLVQIGVWTGRHSDSSMQADRAAALFDNVALDFAEGPAGDAVRLDGRALSPLAEDVARAPFGRDARWRLGWPQ